MIRTVTRDLLPFAGARRRWRCVSGSRRGRRRAKPTKESLLVDVVVAKGGDQVLIVEATGTVQAERVITLQPEISGIIRKEAAGFEVGGRFTKGQELLRIDARDAQIALRQRKAAAQAARLELSLERGRAHVANREWKLLEGKVNTTAEGKALAPRKPSEGRPSPHRPGRRRGPSQATYNVSWWRPRRRRPDQAAAEGSWCRLPLPWPRWWRLTVLLRLGAGGEAERVADPRI